MNRIGNLITSIAAGLVTYLSMVATWSYLSYDLTQKRAPEIFLRVNALRVEYAEARMSDPVFLTGILIEAILVLGIPAFVASYIARSNRTIATVTVLLIGSLPTIVGFASSAISGAKFEKFLSYMFVLIIDASAAFVFGKMAARYQSKWRQED